MQTRAPFFEALCDVILRAAIPMERRPDNADLTISSAMPSLAVVRWILLGFGVVGVLAATGLFEPLTGRPLRAWLRYNERLTGAPGYCVAGRLVVLRHIDGIARWAALAPK